MIIEILSDKIDLILIISGVYFFSIILGGILKKFKPHHIEVFEKTEEQKNQKARKIFGRFKEELKKGEGRSFVICTAMLFIVNLFGVITAYTIGSILVLPLSYLFVDGMRQGASIFTIKGSSFFSILSYCLVVTLEWIAYILAATAGLNIVLSIIEAFQTKAIAFGSALVNSLNELLVLYIWILIVLIIQAIAEVYYVKKVLQKGGSAVPLEPY